MIPDWMKEVDVGPCQCSDVSGGGKSFVQKTLDGVFAFLQESFASESLSRRDGLMQSLDARAKLVSILVAVFALSLTRDMRILLAFYVFELLLCRLSKIEVGFFIKRVWLFIPLFTGIIALPMIFNVFFPAIPSTRWHTLDRERASGLLPCQRRSISLIRESWQRRHLRCELRPRSQQWSFSFSPPGSR